jgi:hypothetical protein
MNENLISAEKLDFADHRLRSARKRNCQEHKDDLAKRDCNAFTGAAPVLARQ